MSRILIVGSPGLESGVGSGGAPPVPVPVPVLVPHWFGVLERSLQLARAAVDMDHEVRLVLVEAQESDVELARSTLADACEVNQVSAISCPSELEHHLASFLPDGLLAVSFDSAEKLCETSTRVPLWCDLFPDSVAVVTEGAAGAESSHQIFLGGSLEGRRIGKVLRRCDAFSSPSVMGAGILCGQLSCEPGLPFEVAGRKRVALLPPDYGDLRNSAPERLPPGPLRDMSEDSFLILGHLVLSASPILCSALRAVMEVRPEVSALFLGDGSLVSRVPGLESLESSMPGRIELLGTVEPRLLPALYERCDLGFLDETRGWADCQQQQQLLEEMAASQLPVLAAQGDGSGIWQSPFLSFQAEDTQGLADKILWAAQHRELAKEQMAQRAVSIVEAGKLSRNVHASAALFRWLESPERDPGSAVIEAAKRDALLKNQSDINNEWSEAVPSASMLEAGDYPTDLRSRIRLWFQAL